MISDVTVAISLILISATIHIVSGQGESCYTPNNSYGFCVVLPQCPSLVEFYGQNQRNPQIIRYLVRAQRNCGTRSIGRNPLVCCNDPVSYNQPPIEPTRQDEFPQTQSPAPEDFTTSTTQRYTEPPTTTTTTTTTYTTTTTPRPTTSSSRAFDESCNDPTGLPGICISIRECPVVLSEFVARQTDDIFIQFIRRSNAICNNVQPFICCPFEKITTTTTASPIPSISQGALQGRLLLPADDCGFSNVTHKRIVGGEAAKPGSWPWITLLGYTNNLGETNWKCGGSLITTRHILTAAHCIKSTLTIARLGEHDISSTTDGTIQDIRIVRTVKHPKYDSRDGNSDLAILYLERDADISSSRVRPVCLPIDDPVRTRTFVGFMPFVAGWGRIQEGGKSSNVLQELQLPVLDNSVCKDRYQKQGKLLTEKQFDDAVICAGVLTGGHDSCQGDSGGPLMQPIYANEQYLYYQIGIVSYGIGCARTDVPGVYTRVQQFTDWIQEKVNEPA